MKSFKLVPACILAAVTLAAVSCQDLHTAHPTTAQNAVMCDKCKVTFVLTGSHSVRHEKMKGMTCPDCEPAVKHFMRTGELKHHCAHCGGSMTCGTSP